MNLRNNDFCLWAVGATVLQLAACSSTEGPARADTAGFAGSSSASTGTSSSPAVGSGGTGASVGVAGTASGGGTSSGGASGSPVPRWVGRVDASDPKAAKFAWQGAGFVATVGGDTISVALRTEGTETAYFVAVIDGDPVPRFKVDSGADRTVALASGLSNTDHVVELYRDTEGMYGSSTFLGFTAGTVKAAPAANDRRIEVVGDSISAGYGNLGSEPHPNWVATPACHWTAENSSWFSSYAAVAGRAMNAEVSTIALSGWGMYRDNNSDQSAVLSSVYQHTLGMDDDTQWAFEPKASVVVINLGTNDWADGDPGVAYETAYLALIAKIRSYYPDAWIFLTIGSMTAEPELTQIKTRLANVVATLGATTGDRGLATFDFGVQDMGEDGSVPTGCDWHPNVADHQRMAGILQQQLASKVGW